MALCLAALPAEGADFALRGQWSITTPRIPDYQGVVLIDGQRRATWDSPQDHGRPARYLGYVRAADASRVEIMLTDRDSVRRVDCLIESSDLLHCHVVFANGRRSYMFALTRIGSGPASLVP